MRVIISPKQVWRRAKGALHKEFKRAELVRDQYDDYLASERIKDKAWLKYVESVPELKILRHACMHGEQGKCRDRSWACPYCRRGEPIPPSELEFVTRKQAAAEELRRVEQVGS